MKMGLCFDWPVYSKNSKFWLQRDETWNRHVLVKVQVKLSVVSAHNGAAGTVGTAAAGRGILLKENEEKNHLFWFLGDSREGNETTTLQFCLNLTLLMLPNVLAQYPITAIKRNYCSFLYSKSLCLFSILLYRFHT